MDVDNKVVKNELRFDLRCRVNDYIRALGLSTDSDQLTGCTRPRFTTPVLGAFYQSISDYVDFAAYRHTAAFIRDNPDNPLIEWMVDEVLKTFGAEIWRQNSPHLVPAANLDIADDGHRQFIHRTIRDLIGKRATRKRRSRPSQVQKKLFEKLTLRLEKAKVKVEPLHPPHTTGSDAAVLGSTVQNTRSGPGRQRAAIIDLSDDPDEPPSEIARTGPQRGRVTIIDMMDDPDESSSESSRASPRRKEPIIIDLTDDPDEISSESSSPWPEQTPAHKHDGTEGAPSHTRALCRKVLCDLTSILRSDIVEWNILVTFVNKFRETWTVEDKARVQSYKDCGRVRKSFRGWRLIHHALDTFRERTRYRGAADADWVAYYSNLEGCAQEDAMQAFYNLQTWVQQKEAQGPWVEVDTLSEDLVFYFQHVIRESPLERDAFIKRFERYNRNFFAWFNNDLLFDWFNKKQSLRLASGAAGASST